MGRSGATGAAGVRLGGDREEAQMIREMGVSLHAEPLGYDKDLGLAYLNPASMPTGVLQHLRALYTSDSGVPVIFFCATCTKVSNALIPRERILVITPAALYYCHPSGEVKRCIPMGEISELVQSDDYWVGIRVPSSYDLLVKPRAPRDSRDLTDVLVRVHAHVMRREGRDRPLRVRRIKHTDRHIKTMLRVSKPKGYAGSAIQRLETRPEEELRRLREAPRAPREQLQAHHRGAAPRGVEARRRQSNAMAVEALGQRQRTGSITSATSQRRSPALPPRASPAPSDSPPRGSRTLDSAAGRPQPSPQRVSFVTARQVSSSAMGSPASGSPPPPSSAASGSPLPVAVPSPAWRRAGGAEEPDEPASPATGSADGTCTGSELPSPAVFGAPAGPPGVPAAASAAAASVLVISCCRAPPPLPAQPPRAAPALAGRGRGRARGGCGRGGGRRSGSPAGSAASPSASSPPQPRPVSTPAAAEADVRAELRGGADLRAAPAAGASPPAPAHFSPPRPSERGMLRAAPQRPPWDGLPRAGAVRTLEAGAAGQPPAALRPGAEAEVCDSPGGHWTPGVVDSVVLGCVAVRPWGWRRAHCFLYTRPAGGGEVHENASLGSPQRMPGAPCGAAASPLRAPPDAYSDPQPPRSPSPPAPHSPPLPPPSPVPCWAGAAGAGGGALGQPSPQRAWLPLDALPSVAVPCRRSDCRVLVADRAWARQKQLRRRLAEDGFDVRGAATATEAVGQALSASARREPLHLVLVALGEEAAAALRQIRARRQSLWPVLVALGDPGSLPVDAALPLPPPEALLGALLRHCFPLPAQC